VFPDHHAGCVPGQRPCVHTCPATSTCAVKPAVALGSGWPSTGALRGVPETSFAKKRWRPWVCSRMLRRRCVESPELSGSAPVTPPEPNSIGALFVVPGVSKQGSTLIGGRGTTFQLWSPVVLDPSGSGQERVVLRHADMLFAGNPASAAVDARRSRSAGRAPPRSPTRSFVSNWVVL
jgi:hypothetical protein